MACSKYTLTNIGTSPVNFNYRRCDDTMWQYQVNLDPNETKNIWLINTTYSVSPIFQSSINLVDLGVFPPTSQPTPTPTATVLVPTPTATDLAPTPTATDLAPTPTATVLAPTPTATDLVPTPTATDLAPTPTATDLVPTPTATDLVPTPTATVLAPTPTPTQVLGNVYFGLGYDSIGSTSACTQSSISTFYGIPSNFSSLTIGDIIYQEIQLINPIGSFYLSDGTNYVQTDSNGEIIVGLTPC